jgi:probable HAF family extracellular repeat protein
MTDLGTLGDINSFGYGINDSGQVVGSSFITGDTAMHAFLYSSGTMSDLGTLGGSNSTAYGIDDAGRVVGSSTTFSGETNAFLYDSSIMTDLGTFPDGHYSIAHGIKDINGIPYVVGAANSEKGKFAFLYSAGIKLRLGTLIDYGGTSLGLVPGESEAFGINNLIQVVGTSTILSGDSHLFLYSGSTMYDLTNMIPSSTPWSSLDQVMGINDNGQIVGSGTINNYSHAFLLTPAYDTSSGFNVIVSLPGTSISFYTCSSGGYTSSTISKDGPTPPAGFQLQGGKYYDITTTADCDPPMTVCITDPAVTASSELLHYENGHFVPKTIKPVNPPTICAQVDSLSPFAIAQTLNKPPVAVCQNVTVTAGLNCTASASINNGSYDPDGDSITLARSPAGPYPLGNTSVSLIVTDSNGASSQCTGMVTVIDKTPPSITEASTNPSTLWPPNHKMVSVTVNYNATDICGQPACQISGVSSNEPITNSDYAIVDAHHVELSADRLGGGNGRIYTISITCTDTSGNISNQAVKVIVPHDRGK